MYASHVRCWPSSSHSALRDMSCILADVSRAMVLRAYGAPDVLVPADVEPPEPAAGQIRIRVKAAGVGPTDLDIRRGNLQRAFPLTLPAVLGFEAAGVVDVVGPGVTGVRPGDEVVALLPQL